MNARRTVVRLTFDGVDISADINRYLQSLSYTDNEQAETDDLQLTLDDREGVWLGNWLNTPAASKGAEPVSYTHLRSDDDSKCLRYGIVENGRNF